LWWWEVGEGNNGLQSEGCGLAGTLMNLAMQKLKMQPETTKFDDDLWGKINFCSADIRLPRELVVGVLIVIRDTVSRAFDHSNR
jgi:hypothetical protein